MNATLLREIADQIERHPELYYQAAFFARSRCGTRHCIAGWACTLRAEEVEWESGRYPNSSHAIPLKGWSDTAEGLLGLPSPVAWRLFDAVWLPREGMTVPEALRALADGADIESVSKPLG